MGALAYYTFYAFMRLLTLLPLPLLYPLSWLLFLFLYIFPGYRRKIVRENLINSFPDKNLREIRQIERSFYMHLSDIFIESFKALNMKEKDFSRRYVFTNPELPLSIIASGRDVMAVAGHYGNWEWFVSAPLFIPCRIITVYKPLRNKRYDSLMLRLRSRFGIVLSPMSRIVRDISGSHSEGLNSLCIFIADQSPPKKDIKYRTTFLNQDTPVYLGPEKIAARYNMAVLFLHVKKTGRGRYELTFEELAADGGELPEYAITEAHTRRLQQIIEEKPEYWMWSHRRWKHAKRED